MCYNGTMNRFDQASLNWDQSQRRNAMAEAVAAAIGEASPLKPDAHILDVGAGTGLLSEKIAGHVGKITALDASAGMIEAFLKKKERFACPVEAIRSDVAHFERPEAFEGIISSMALHHIPRTGLFFEKLYAWLKPGGFIAVADLCPEDGSFHDGGNDGVHHFGFEKETLTQLAQAAGFASVRYEIVHTIEKDAGARRYDLFLLTALKQ